MTDIPIIMSGPMVLAALAGHKTMTRRLAEKPTRTALVHEDDPPLRMTVPSRWQRVRPGDRLWVREALNWSKRGWVYKADGALIQMNHDDPRVAQMVAWAHHKEQEYAPSIHMPRWASRLTMVVTASKIEPVYDISDDDIRAEGIIETDTSWLNAWRQLWESIHGPKHWDSNTDVVAISFKVHQGNIDRLKEAGC